MESDPPADPRAEFAHEKDDALLLASSTENLDALMRETAQAHVAEEQERSNRFRANVDFIEQPRQVR